MVYEEILDKYRHFQCTPSQFNTLKIYFKSDIDSKRSYDNIKSLKDLIIILLKRDCLDKLDQKLPLTLNINASQLNSVQRTPDLPKVLPPISNDPIQRVYDLVAAEIGQKWKDLARALDISEGKIDEFSLLYPRLEEIVKEILQYHREMCPENYWRSTLCNALDTARRKDLRHNVQRILNMYGM